MLLFSFFIVVWWMLRNYMFKFVETKSFLVN